MPARLAEVEALVADLLRKKAAEMHPDHQPLARELASSPVLAEVGRLFFEAIGLGVANDGEIYDPAPPPRAAGVADTRQSGVRWSGSSNRRGRYKR